MSRSSSAAAGPCFAACSKLTASVAAFAVLTTGVVAGAVSSEAVAEQVKVLTEAADINAASQAARNQRGRVLVKDQTTPDTLTWANADGTLTSQITNGPVRFRQADGQWHEIDLTLERHANGSVSPRNYPTPLVMAGGGGEESALQDLVRQGSGARTIAWQWLGVLPEPVLDENRATYPDVRPGIDLVVEARRTGFEQFFVLTERPISAPVLELPLRLGSDVEASEAKNGDIVYRDDNEAIVARTPRAAAWSIDSDDVSKPRTGIHQVRMDLTGTSARDRSARIAPTREDDGVVKLTVAADLLEDPETTYPFVVDPSVTLGNALYDTWVLDTTTYNGGSDAYLYVGPYIGGEKTRAYLNWNISAIQNSVVSAATLTIYNTQTRTTPYPTIKIGHTSTLASSSTNWSSKPTMYDDDSYTYTVGTVGAIAPSILNTAQAWAASGTSVGGMGIRSNPEPGTRPMVFKSTEATSNIPTISVTYNSRPNQAGVPSPDGAYTTTGGTTYVNTTSPVLRSLVSDADGGQVRAKFTVKEGATTLLSAVSGSLVNSGGYSTYTVPSGTFVHGHTYTVTALANDGALDSGAVSESRTVTVDTVSPATPSISSTAITDGSWSSSTSVTVPLTFTSSSGDLSGWFYTINGDLDLSLVDTSSHTLDLRVPPGWVIVQVWAADGFGNYSAPATFSFGNGGGVTQPAEGVVVDRYTPLEASGPPAATSVKFEYRLGGETTWNAIPPAHVKNDGTAITSWPVTAGHPDGFRSSSPQRSTGGTALAWDIAATVNSNLVSAVVEVRAVFGDVTNTWPTAPASTTLDRLAVSSSFATESVGACEINLWNGDCSLTTTDASVGELTIGRSYRTKTPDAAGPFGPGWSTNLPSPNLVDADTFVTVTETGGDIVGFNRSGSTYTPSEETTRASLTRTGSGISATYEYIRADGTSASFAGTSSTGAGPTSAVPWTFRIKATEALGSATEVAYSYVGGKLTQILAPLPVGGPASCASWVAGCTAFQLSYFDASGGPGTDPSLQRVSKVTLKTVDGSGSIRNVDLVCYGYQASAPYRLTSVWDPRTTASTCGTPVVATSYAYDTAPARLASVMPPGQAAFNIHYNDYTNTAPAIAAAKVDYVQRQHDAAHGSGVARTSLVYDAPIGSTSTANHPDFSSDRRSAWGQTGVPVTATAIFPPGYSVSTTDLRDATVRSLDVTGRSLNRATYSGTGQAGWKASTTTYDRFGNVVAELSAKGRDQAIAGICGTAGLAAGCSGAQIAIALSSVSIYDDDGSELRDTFGPLTWNTYSDSGEFIGNARTHTAYTYGTGNMADRTADGPEGSVTKVVVGASRSALAVPVNEADRRTTTTAYGLSSSDFAGWDLRQPMRVTTKVPGEDIVRETRYDSATGEIVEVRQPSAVGISASPGTTKHRYYVAGAHDPANCVKTAWAGLPCKTEPGAQPTASGRPKLPVTTYSDYDYLGRSTAVGESVVDAAGATQTRTTVITYDGPGGIADRIKTTDVASSVGIDTPLVTYNYDAISGLPTTLDSGSGSLGGTVTKGYDDFGRTDSYTDGDGAVTSYTFGSHGRVSSVTNKNSSNVTVNTASYGYDGGGERRHIPTSVTYGNSVGTFAASYDADGAVVRQNWPNGMIETVDRDIAGRATWLQYQNGSFYFDDLVSFTAHGQVGYHNGYTVSSRHSYSYDPAGRLVETRETRGGSCTTRTYAFDVDSNRSVFNNYSPGAGGSCSRASVTAGGKWLFFDDADRLTHDYDMPVGYDAFGRTKDLPGSLAADGAGRSLDYYANDRNATIKVTGGATTTVTLDPTGRDRRTSTTASSQATLNHFAGPGDSPAWTDETSSSGATSRMTFNAGFLGGIAVITSNAGGTTPPISYQLTNIHGDVARTTTPGATAGPDGAAYDADEYGIQRDTNGTRITNANRYGWLGAVQRSADAASGLVRMGARLYNPRSGTFLSVDPVPGGNASPYAYPGDPVGSRDLDGRQEIRPYFTSVKECICRTWIGPWHYSYGSGIEWSSWGGKAKTKYWWATEITKLVVKELVYSKFHGWFDTSEYQKQFRYGVSYSYYWRCYGGVRQFGYSQTAHAQGRERLIVRNWWTGQIISDTGWDTTSRVKGFYGFFNWIGDWLSA